MIRTLHIKNYRCLRDVTLTLEPLTVFVGGNASGKSSVFAALQGRFELNQVWRRDPRITASLAIERDGRTTEWSFGPSGTNIGSGAWPATQLLQFDLAHLRSPNQLQEARRLSDSGQGLANVHATLTRRVQGEVAKRFCDLVPMFADVDTRPLGAGTHRLVFQDRWDSNLWYEPEQVSDGTVLMLAFQLLAHQAPAPEVIAIEEPERGLHPFLMGELIRSLRDLALPPDGRQPIQVILATHSADLLEFVEPHEVRFLHRSKDTGETLVKMAPTNDPNWLKTLKAYDNSLGDLWLSGSLGGVPGN